MGRAYSMDLRERVVAAVAEEGLSRRQAATRFGVSDSTAINWLKRVATTGSVAPGQIGGHKPKKIAGAHRDWLVGRVPGRLAARPGRGAMAPRRADQWRDVPPLRRQGPRPDPAARRHRRHGQSRLAQEQGRAARHQGGRRPPALPAQILARPEPHRAALLEAQALAPKSRRPNRRRRLQRPRPDPRDRHPTRVLTLLRPRRVRTIVNSSRSR